MISISSRHGPKEDYDAPEAGTGNARQAVIRDDELLLESKEAERESKMSR